MGQLVEFSIIITTYNRRCFLRQAICSVWEQTHTDFELIVVDDGSSDGTMDYLLSLGPRVKVLRQANRGPGAARNLGVRHAAGRYVAFLDSDDVWFPWALATFHTAIQDHREPSLINAALLVFQGKVPDVEQDDFTAEHFSDYFETANDPADVRSAALVAKRAIFDRADGFDETMSVGEDLDFYFRAGTCRHFVRVRSPMTLGYRRHPGNMSTAPALLYSAAVEVLTRETNGLYPGGKVRQKERWKLISRTVRPVALSCLKAGLAHEAWRLYRKSFVMNARLGRFRFLTGFVFYWILGLRLGGRNPLSSKELKPGNGVVRDL
jgi:glycosyltransferase involved in cell wall biosynthesis